MDEQVEKAVQIAWSPTSDQDLKAQAFDFLNQLRSDPSGGQVCLTLFTAFPKREEIVRHFALDMVGNSIQNEQLDAQSLGYVKNSLMEYIRRTYGGFGGEGGVDSANIQNKLTQTITYLFASLYATGWEEFFGDFLGLVSAAGSSGGNVAGAALYLRVLSSVHDEIADVLVPRPQTQQKRNMQLKDLVRERDVRRVVSSWQEILSQWRENDAVVEMCLKVIGRWASWIDISLVVNNVLLNLLFQLVGRTGVRGATDKVRDAAIDTLTEIAGKKMKPPDKIELILFLNLGNVIAQLVTSPALHELRSTSSYDTDLAEAVGKLVNNVVADTVKALDTESIDEGTRQRADELLRVFLPYLLRFFSDEYDEICSTAIPSLTDILTFFRKEVKSKGSLAQRYAAMLSPILNAVIIKMKYDETSSWGNEDEKTDEAEFQELRKRLQQLQQAIAAVDEPLYMDVVGNIVANTFSGFNQQNPHMDWRDIDLALHEMFLFGELAVKAGGLYSKGQPTGPAAATLVGMMHKMVDSGIASFSHPAIQLQYMEICVRYASFFESQPQHIPQVLETFVRFVHHNHIRVKARSWYLFHRFVKHLRAQLGNVAQTVIETISDLLLIRAELPKERADDEDMSSDESDHSEESIFNSQLYLFEAVGCISSTSSILVEKQVLYGRLVMNPLFVDMEKHINLAKGGDERAQLQIHHDIMALGTLARGFSDWSPGGTSPNQAPPPPEAVSEEFKRGAEATLVALESLRSSQNVRLAARSAFSRFVGVLGARILPQLPRWIDGLLSQSSTKDEMATFLRMLDQVVYGFKTEIYNILDSLLTPLLQRVFAGLAEETSGTDDEIQLAELQREYLNFLLVILNNDLGSVLVSEVNQNGFASLITIVEHFAQDISDLQTSKLAFGVLHKMSTTWGGPDIITPPTTQQTSTNIKVNSNNATALVPTPPSLPGFDRYMIERFSPVGWRILSNPSLNPKEDAQARTVVWEVASLQKTIYAKTGAAFIEHLRGVYFPNVNIPQGPAEEYLQALQTLDSKAFRQFFQVSIFSSLLIPLTDILWVGYALTDVLEQGFVQRTRG
ncbi:MAG: pre-tRNA nuclear export protein [Geoglossum umbratile]|nr:MAG: pre-tRNA nuclear export protein [Geoglossum umbratile]